MQDELTTQVDPADFDKVIFWAFRYCLGRGSPCVVETSDILIKYWDRLALDTRKLIVKEIKGAIAAGNAGPDKYVLLWERVVRCSAKAA